MLKRNSEAIIKTKGGHKGVAEAARVLLEAVSALLRGRE
jgi:hypothetical protein